MPAVTNEQICAFIERGGNMELIDAAAGGADQTIFNLPDNRGTVEIFDQFRCDQTNNS